METQKPPSPTSPTYPMPEHMEIAPGGDLQIGEQTIPRKRPRNESVEKQDELYERLHAAVAQKAEEIYRLKTCMTSIAKLIDASKGAMPTTASAPIGVLPTTGTIVPFGGTVSSISSTGAPFVLDPQHDARILNELCLRIDDAAAVFAKTVTSPTDFRFTSKLSETAAEFLVHSTTRFPHGVRVFKDGKKTFQLEPSPRMIDVMVRIVTRDPSFNSPSDRRLLDLANSLLPSNVPHHESLDFKLELILGDHINAYDAMAAKTSRENPLFKRESIGIDIETGHSALFCKSLHDSNGCEFHKGTLKDGKVEFSALQLKPDVLSDNLRASSKEDLYQFKISSTHPGLASLYGWSILSPPFKLLRRVRTGPAKGFS